METVVKQFEQKYRKTAIVDVKSGDTVRVSQKIREAGKERTQVFEGMVIRTRRMGSLTANITVRKIASGVGVEKSYQLHSPNVISVKVVRRGKVRRNFLSYIRKRQGKAMRLAEKAFDAEAVNIKDEPKKTEEKPVEATAEDKAEAEAEKAAEQADAKAEAKAEQVEQTTDAETKETKPAKEDKKEDKAAAKKAKAEEFRKAQEAKK